MTRTRTRALAVVLALAVVAGMAAPAGAQVLGDDGETPYDGKQSLAAKEIDGLVDFSVPDYVVTYGAEGDPGYYITFEDGELSSLEEWANESDRREILDRDNASDRALVSAPPFAVHGGLGFVRASVLGFEFSRPTFADGLVTESYVEHVDVNFRAGYVEPEQTLINASDYEPPASNAAVRGGWTTQGVAFNEDTEQTNLTAVRNLTGADNVTETGSGITVAVIDTGANVGDGRIYGNGSANSSIRITAGKNFISNQTVGVGTSDPDWSVVADGNGHGSWVASAVAANVSGTEHDGMAPDANLLVAKALDDEGQGDIEDIRAAVEWAEANGADVITMSLGSPIYSPTLADELREAIHNGSVSVVTVAVGNSRQNPATRYVASPADAPVEGVVGVAATNVTANATADTAASAYFSNVGPDPARDFSNGVTAGVEPDVAAPGMKVVAPVLTTTDGIRRNRSLSGTSMATPIVAGGYALVLEKRGEWVNETAVAEWTQNTSRRMPEAGTTEVGAGMLAVDRLADKETADETQDEARDTDAEGRDQANRSFGGNRIVQTLAGVRRGVS